jgi:hypothetical protein
MLGIAHSNSCELSMMHCSSSTQSCKLAVLLQAEHEQLRKCHTGLEAQHKQLTQQLVASRQELLVSSSGTREHC